MAAKGEVGNEFQPSEVGETNPTSAQSDNVDALVSSFLAELTDISSEVKPVRQPGVDRETPADNAAPSEERQAKIPPSLKLDKEARSESKLDLEGINNEVEKSLIELESLKAKVVPISDRTELRAEPQSPTAASLKQSTPQPGAEPARSPVRNLEEQAWDGLEIFRARVASAEFRRRRNIFLILTAAVLALILGYFCFFRLNRITPASDPSGQIPDLESPQLNPATASSGVLPDKPENLNPSVQAKRAFHPDQPFPPAPRFKNAPGLNRKQQLGKSSLRPGTA